MPAASRHRRHLCTASCLCLLYLISMGVVYAQSIEPETKLSESQPRSEQKRVLTQVHLFFTDDRNQFLKAEKRTLPLSGDPVADGRQIITQLLQGPKEGLHQIIPDGTQLRSFFITPDGTAFADFSDALRENHPGGCRIELLTLFAIVNSLILNIPEIKQVNILIEGQESLTLAGHIDTRFPYQADMLLIR